MAAEDEDRFPKTKKSGMRVDLPASWQTSAWWITLDPYQRYVYVAAMMWSQGQGLDGRFPGAALGLVDKDADRAEEALNAICDLTGRVEKTADGWTFLDWSGVQEQSTAAEIEHYRSRNRKNQAASRRRRAPPVTGDVTGDVTEDVGKARKGEATTREATKGEVRAGALGLCPGGKSHWTDSETGRCWREKCPSNIPGAN